jgi:ABC-type spermidine/putrescine transport system permease subunit I
VRPRTLLLVPSLLWFTAFFVAPLALVLIHSFGRMDLVTFEMRFDWNLQNYRNILDPIYFRTLLRSLALSTSTTILCALVGLPVAYFISRQNDRWQRGLLVLVIVPFWTSFVVRIYAMVNALENGGPIDTLARDLHLVSARINVLYTPRAIAIGMLYSYLPLMVLPIYVALERIHPSVLDAASDLGANGWQLFRRVILPLAVPGLAAGAVIVGISATGEYVIPEILGGGKTLMLGNVIADQFLNVGDYPFGSAIAVSLLLVLTLLLLVGRGTQRMEAIT